LQVNRLKEQKRGERKSKGTTLKMSGQKEENSEEDSSECSDTKSLNLLTRKFNKFLNKKGKERN